MDYEINKSKYLTVVGHIQSGKTNEEIYYCWSSFKNYQLPVIFVVRNITADQLQLRDRFNKSGLNLLVKLLKNVSIEDAVSYLEHRSVIILLCNEYQLEKMVNVLKLYRGEYNLCIDEVDFSIKSKLKVSKIDIQLSKLKECANHILGATATPFAVFCTEKSLSKIKKMKPGKNYHGIESLKVNFIESCNKSDFPYSDTFNISEIYNSCLMKESCVLLHTVVKEKDKMNKLFEYLGDIYPTFTYIVYNGDGIKVRCDDRPDGPLTRPKALNDYNQLINNYHYTDNYHYFENYSISEVLQLLVDDIYPHNHISIISGQLASRGISFVSSDYSLHLTDQYLDPGKNAHGETLLQSLRILGCYKEQSLLNLWCSERTWENIINYSNIMNKIVSNIDDDHNWLVKIKNVNISKPNKPMTRPKLLHGTKFNSIKNEEQYNIDIDFFDESESEEE